MTWRGDRDISLVSKSALRGASKKANFAHPQCLIGCERNISDVEGPVDIVVDSSSLWWNFRAQIVPCPGAGHGGYNDISLVSTKAFNLCFHKRKQLCSHIVCFIGCEVGVADVESPPIKNRSTLFAEFSVRE